MYEYTHEISQAYIARCDARLRWVTYVNVSSSTPFSQLRSVALRASEPTSQHSTQPQIQNARRQFGTDNLYENCSVFLYFYTHKLYVARRRRPENHMKCSNIYGAQTSVYTNFIQYTLCSSRRTFFTRHPSNTRNQYAHNDDDDDIDCSISRRQHKRVWGGFVGSFGRLLSTSKSLAMSLNVYFCGITETLTVCCDDQYSGVFRLDVYIMRMCVGANGCL